MHARLGGTLLRPEPESLLITGAVPEWESWVGMAFPETGEYVFPHGLDRRDRPRSRRRPLLGAKRLGASRRQSRGPRPPTRLVPMQGSLPVAERPRRPEWMKVRAPSKDGKYWDVRKLLHGAEPRHGLRGGALPEHRGVLGTRGTATFQILGDTCTRACRYLLRHLRQARASTRPLEPLRLAQAAATMGLSHVVVTSVDRDDLDDGAAHFAATIRALKAKLPEASVEVLTRPTSSASRRGRSTR